MKVLTIHVIISKNGNSNNNNNIRGQRVIENLDRSQSKNDKSDIKKEYDPNRKF